MIGVANGAVVVLNECSLSVRTAVHQGGHRLVETRVAVLHCGSRHALGKAQDVIWVLSDGGVVEGDHVMGRLEGQGGDHQQDPPQVGLKLGVG